MSIAKILVAIIMVLGCYGCTTEEIKDVPKTIWGSTTRVLEQARSNAITKTYDRNYWDCFKAAQAVARKKYVIFQKDEVRGIMVIMGIPGSVDTTEVGVFFVELSDQQTRIELASLSTNAKRLLSKGLFHGMDITLGLLPPDKIDISFSAEEFQKPMTAELLLKMIQSDGFVAAPANNAVDALNLLLGDDKFYDDWTGRKGRTIFLSDEIQTMVNIKDKNKDQIKRLNRLLLELTYPSNCPKNTEE